jgi:anti-anti-sigma regulatory factor
MELKVIEGNTLQINGNIKTQDDYVKIKETITILKNKGVSEITLDIVDSFSMTSSVIGFLLKTIHQDKIKVNIIIGDERLYSLLNDLRLLSFFSEVTTTY